MNTQKYKDFEGVKYPDPPKQFRKGYDPETGMPYTKPFHGYFSTQQAAEKLNIGISAARRRLQRHKVRFIIVQYNKQGACYYWYGKDIDKISVRDRPILEETEARELLTHAEVCEMLGVVNSELFRICSSGALARGVYRVKTPQGLPRRALYKPEDVKAYDDWRRKSGRSSFVRPGCNPETRRPYSEPLAGYLSLDEVASVLDILAESARVRMRRDKVSFIEVQKRGQTKRRYWHQSEVLALAGKMIPIATDEVIESMFTREQAMYFTGVSHATLATDLADGFITAQRYRVRSATGLRERIFFTKEELERYMKWRTDIGDPSLFGCGRVCYRKNIKK